MNLPATPTVQLSPPSTTPPIRWNTPPIALPIGPRTAGATSRWGAAANAAVGAVSVRSTASHRFAW